MLAQFLDNQRGRIVLTIETDRRGEKDAMRFEPLTTAAPVNRGQLAVRE